MAQMREEGWPLGLQPLNARIGLIRNRDLSGSVSFSTLVTASPTSSSDSSSDLDTESTGSFFHDKSITLGSLIGTSSIIELSRRSTRRRTTEVPRGKKICKSRPWLFSLCSKLNAHVASANNAAAPSLGHFLEAERSATRSHGRNRNQNQNQEQTQNQNQNQNQNQSPNAYGPNDFSPVRVVSGSEHNSLFVNGQIAPQPSAPLGPEGARRSLGELLEHGNRYGAPLLFSCLCVGNSK